MMHSQKRALKTEALCSYLNSFINYERYKYFPRKVNLNDYKNFLGKIDNPQKKLSPSILIAGTNGKGSTAVILSSILSKGGYCIGLFTSPHILSYRERIKINGKSISRKEFEDCLNSLKPYLDDPYEKRHRTFFEVLTTVSFVHFMNKKTDLNIFEVGLGGRLDSTNTITPFISVITSIGFDHTRTLGGTLAKIAQEKCGIIREGGTVITSAQHKNAMGVIKQIAKERSAQLYNAGEEVKLKPLCINEDGIRFSYKNKEYFVPLRGRLQLKNISTALLTIEVLAKKEFTIQEKILRKGLKECEWLGRFQVVKKNPLIILDGAHNPSAMREMIKSIKDIYPQKRLIVIFSCLSSKDKKSMALMLEKVADRIILTGIETERATKVSDLKRVFKKKVFSTDNITSALKLAMKHVDKNSLILITGSVYLVSEAYVALKT
jgi:dihydrofolate synthase/folylpolyglutamate synthase